MEFVEEAQDASLLTTQGSFGFSNLMIDDVHGIALRRGV